MPDELGPDDDYRAEIRRCISTADWHGAYRWAKGWVGSGGASSVEPWLVYVAAALREGRPKVAVRSTDLALEHWVHDREQRAFLRYLRGLVVWRAMADPKTAVGDLVKAETDCPAWLRAELTAARQACADAAQSSRKRTASVPPAPAYCGSPEGLPEAREPRTGLEEPPPLWHELRAAVGNA